ncbi:MAG: hypothetical protein PVSMB7_09010 [Chloroflexota bacterium]
MTNGGGVDRLSSGYATIGGCTDYLPASGRFPWFAFFMRSFFSLRRRVLAMILSPDSALRYVSRVRTRMPVQSYPGGDVTWR